MSERTITITQMGRAYGKTYKQAEQVFNFIKDMIDKNDYPISFHLAAKSDDLLKAEKELKALKEKLATTQDALARAMVGLEEYRTLIIQHKEGPQFRLGSHAEVSIEAVCKILGVSKYEALSKQGEK